MKIERMNKGNWGKVRAFFDLTTEDGFTIKGFKLIEGINGIFVSMPSQKGNDGEYRDTIWLDSKSLRDEVTNLAMDFYNNTTETMGPEPVAAEAQNKENSNPESVIASSSGGNLSEKTSSEPETFKDEDIPF